jgi:Zn-dependent oligopeptidase
VLSKAYVTSLWKDCFVKDPLSSEVGNRYRREILAKGGTAKPSDMIQAFTQNPHPLTLDYFLYPRKT